MASENGKNMVHVIKDHHLRISGQTSTFLLNASILTLSDWEPASCGSLASSFGTALIGYINQEKLENTWGNSNTTFLRTNIFQPMRIIQLVVEKTFLEALCRILPNPFIQIKGSIEDLGLYGCKGETHLFDKLFDLKDMTLSAAKNGDQELSPSFSTTSSSTNGNCSLSIVVGWITPPQHRIQISTGSIIQSPFENESTKDLTIVAGNGAEIKCHGMMFAAQSTVLTAMISPNGMKESELGKVELPENSEQGIRLLLRYLYGLELVTEGIPCDLMLELFQTAHKYDLTLLQSELYKLLMEKDVNWFTPDVVLELYFYAMNVKGFKNLKDHALSIMTRMNPRVLSACPEFKKLDRDTAVNLLCEQIMLFQN